MGDRALRHPWCHIDAMDEEEPYPSATLFGMVNLCRL